MVETTASLPQRLEQFVADHAARFSSVSLEPRPDGFGNTTILEGRSSGRGPQLGLIVLHRGDCFEVAVSVEGARGPAEWRTDFGDPSRDAGDLLIDFLSQLVTGKTSIDVFNRESLLHRPSRLAFFHQPGRVQHQDSVDSISWPQAEPKEEKGQQVTGADR